VNCESFNNIYSLVAETQKFKNLNLKTWVFNTWTPITYWNNAPVHRARETVKFLFRNTPDFIWLTAQFPRFESVDHEVWRCSSDASTAPGYATSTKFLCMLPIAVARSSSGRVTKSKERGAIFGGFFSSNNALNSISFGYPYKNGWTDRDAVWADDSGGP